MSEQDLVKGLLEMGFNAILIAYVFRLDTQRNIEASAHRVEMREMAERRSEDANKWLGVLMGIRPPNAFEFSPKSPTKLE